MFTWCSCECRQRTTSVWDMMPLILSSLEGDSVTYTATWCMLLAGDLGGRMMLPGLENRKHCLRIEEESSCEGCMLCRGWTGGAPDDGVHGRTLLSFQGPVTSHWAMKRCDSIV